MAERTASLTITFNADLTAAKATVEKQLKEWASQEIDLRLGAGGGPGAPVGNAATFGNLAGTPMAGITTAAQRLDAVSMARSTGPAIQMMNGQAGAAAGGLVNSAAARLDAVSAARMASVVTPGSTGGTPVASVITPRSGPPAVHLPGATRPPTIDELRMSPDERAAMIAQNTAESVLFRSQARAAVQQGAAQIVTRQTGGTAVGGVARTSFNDILAARGVGELSQTSSAYLGITPATAIAGVGAGVAIHAWGSVTNQRQAIEQQYRIGMGVAGNNLVAQAQARAQYVQSRAQFAHSALDSTIGSVPLVGGFAMAAYRYADPFGFEEDEIKARRAVTTAEYGVQNRRAVRELAIDRIGIGAGGYGAQFSAIQQGRQQAMELYTRQVAENPESTGTALKLRVERFKNLDVEEQVAKERARIDAVHSVAGSAASSFIGQRSFYGGQMMAIDVAESQALARFDLENKNTPAAERSALRAAIVIEHGVKRGNLAAQTKHEAAVGAIESGGALAAARLGAAGQTYNAENVRIDSRRQAALAGIVDDVNNPEYKRKWQSVIDSTNAEYISNAAQYDLSNQRGAMGVRSETRSRALMMGGSYGAAGRERVNQEYAQSMLNFQWSQPRAMEVYEANYGRWQQGMREVEVGERRRSIGQTGMARSITSLLSDNPLQAQMDDITTQYEQQRAGMTNPIELAKSHVLERMEKERTQQIFDNQRKMVGIGQRFTGEGLDRQLARDPYGARAAGIAGDTISEANQLAFAGMPEEAERARGLGLKRLQLERQDYGDAYRSSAFNPWTMGMNPRDIEDPAKVFAQYSKQEEAIRDASLGSDIEPGKGAEIVAALGQIQNFLNNFGTAIGQLTGKTP